ncbi:MAG TPA: lysine/arginine/ornithine ABC transporter substrate-binding protein [Azospirillum sp.]
MRQTIVALALGAVALAFTGGAADAKEWKKIRIATEGAYAPWNATDASGKLVGFEPDLAKELCKRMNAECEVVAQDWDGIIPALQQGKFDAIMAGMSITDERKQVIDFSRPYGSDPVIFATLKNGPLAAVKTGVEHLDLATVDPAEQKAIDALAAALKGKTVGVQVSTIHAEFMQKHLPKVEIRTYDKLDNAGIDLASGRVDAMIGDRSAVEAIAKEAKTMALFGPNLTGGVLGVGVGVGLRKADADLKAQFDKAIADATKDGTVGKLSTQWFGFDISVK